jgi:hypothetical protein
MTKEARSMWIDPEGEYPPLPLDWVFPLVSPGPEQWVDPFDIVEAE